MKKTMILALAVLGMVLGSFAVIEPVKAQGYQICPYVLTDPHGCHVYLCNEGEDNACTIWACGTSGAINTCVEEEIAP